MSERNALPLIKKALEEKLVEVFLPGEGSPRKLYLIKISGEIDPFRDFCVTYHDRIDKADFKKAKRLLDLEKPEVLKNHGVLIDPETLEIVFTFNMAFADFHRDGKRLVRFPLSEIFPVVIPEYYGKPCRDGDPCFGPRAKTLVGKLGYFPRKKVTNSLASFESALSRHVVSVRLPGETALRNLYLLKIWAKTNSEEDLRISCPGYKLFTGPFGGLVEKEEFREYGLFISFGLDLVFAFNTAFARYDSETKTVEYSTVAEKIIKGLQQRATEPRPRTGGMHGVIMYALSEPRKK